MLNEFFKFLKEYNIMALSIAFIMGVASTSLVGSFVGDIMMPIIGGESWKEASLDVGNVTLQWGSFLAEVINFLILLIIVFFIAKILKEEKE